MGIAAFVLAHWGLLYLPLCVAVPPLFVKLHMNYLLPIHHHLIWCGSELGAYGDTQIEGHWFGSRQQHLQQFYVFNQCIDKLWIYQHFILYRHILYVSLGFSLVASTSLCSITTNSNQIYQYSQDTILHLLFFMKEILWLYWPWMKTAFMNVLADECFEMC